MLDPGSQVFPVKEYPGNHGLLMSTGVDLSLMWRLVFVHSWPRSSYCLWYGVRYKKNIGESYQCSLVVEHELSTQKALSSISITLKPKGKKKRCRLVKVNFCLFSIALHEHPTLVWVLLGMRLTVLSPPFRWMRGRFVLLSSSLPDRPMSYCLVLSLSWAEFWKGLCLVSRAQGYKWAWPLGDFSNSFNMQSEVFWHIPTSSEDSLYGFPWIWVWFGINVVILCETSKGRTLNAIHLPLLLCEDSLLDPWVMDILSETDLVERIHS